MPEDINVGAAIGGTIEDGLGELQSSSTSSGSSAAASEAYQQKLDVTSQKLDNLSEAAEKTAGVLERSASVVSEGVNKNLSEAKAVAASDTGNRVISNAERATDQEVGDYVLGLLKKGYESIPVHKLNLAENIGQGLSNAILGPLSPFINELINFNKVGSFIVDYFRGGSDEGVGSGRRRGGLGRRRSTSTETSDSSDDYSDESRLRRRASAGRRRASGYETESESTKSEIDTVASSVLGEKSFALDLKSYNRQVSAEKKGDVKENRATKLRTETNALTGTVGREIKGMRQDLRGKGGVGGGADRPLTRSERARAQPRDEFGQFVSKESAVEKAKRAQMENREVRKNRTERVEAADARRTSKKTNVLIKEGHEDIVDELKDINRLMLVNSLSNLFGGGLGRAIVGLASLAKRFLPVAGVIGGGLLAFNNVKNINEQDDNPSVLENAEGDLSFDSKGGGYLKAAAGGAALAAPLGLLGGPLAPLSVPVAAAGGASLAVLATALHDIFGGGGESLPEPDDRVEVKPDTPAQEQSQLLLPQPAQASGEYSRSSLGGNKFIDGDSGFLMINLGAS